MEPKLSIQLTAQDAHLEVRAVALEGEARSRVPLPPRWVYEAAYSLSHWPAAESTLSAVGAHLYQCLTSADAGELARAVFERARSDSQPVHMELRFDPDQTGLAQLPWEVLEDRSGRQLVRDGLANVTRYITYPQAPPALAPAYQTGSLLRVVAQPSDQPPFDVGALDLPHVERLDHASFDELERVLLLPTVALWGVHFEAHGAVFATCRCGETVSSPTSQFLCPRCGAPLELARLTALIAFEQDGRSNFVAAEDVGALLFNSRASLAMLLACESASVGGKTLFSGLAPNLILAGVPAVIGMQYRVSPACASQFAQHFYAALLAHGDIVAAMGSARMRVRHDQWYGPVLYLRQLAHRAPAKTTYRTRHIDTAAPATVQAGQPFLARLWIRRPTTRPLSDEQLRRELGVADQVGVSTSTTVARMRFEPVEDRLLRCGDVQVELAAAGCRVRPHAITLFVDEDLDAPAAIFVVTPEISMQTALLRFSVYQDGGLIGSLNQSIDVVEGPVARAALRRGAYEARIHGGPGMQQPRLDRPAASFALCPVCGTKNPPEGRFCLMCGAPLRDAAPQRPPAGPAPARDAATQPAPPPHATVGPAPHGRGADPAWRRYGGATAGLIVLLLVGIFALTRLPDHGGGIPGIGPFATATTMSAAAGGDTKVAVLAPLTGQVPAFGVSTRNGALLAIEEWNAKGGVNGRKIVPVVEDSQCSPDPAVNAAQKVIAQDRIKFIIGEVCSSASIPISEIANQAGVVQISPSSTNPSVTVDKNGKTKEYGFRAASLDPVQAQAAAKFAVDTLKAKTAFVMQDENNGNSGDLAGAFTRSFTSSGGQVAGNASYTSTDTDFSAILEQIAAAQPDIVYLPDLYNVANRVTRQAKEKGIKATFMGNDGWNSPDLDVKAAAGSYFTDSYSPQDPRAEVQDFVKSFGARYKDDQGQPQVPDALAALAYDATNLLLQAMLEAGSDNPEKVKDALAKIQFNGVTGKITFDRQHNPVKAVTVMAVSEDGAKFHSLVDP